LRKIGGLRIRRLLEVIHDGDVRGFRMEGGGRDGKEV
jgi:hypothetical protein